MSRRTRSRAVPQAGDAARRGDAIKRGDAAVDRATVDRVATVNRPDPLARYRPWFYAAALYNLVWGVVAILFPARFFALIGMPEPNYPALWQVVGMFVMVYAPAYWWVGRFPTRHRHFILIGLAGKVFGPLGFVWSAATGELPLAFGLTILTNDLIWWPAFALFLRDAARLSGGWARLLSGE